MSAKTEATSPTPEAGAAPAAPAKAGLKPWLPVLLALILAPAVSFGVAQFVLVPQLKASLGGDSSAPAAAPAKPEGGHGKSGGHKGAETGALNTFKFENVVVNLAGTMGTRYLKTTFIVTGPQSDLAARFETARPQLLDVTISVLSSLSLSDLEEPGAKNIIREKLVNSYNQALGQRVADQVFFSEFVVQ